jgi:hypothetical protein
VPADADQLLHGACQALRDGYADLRRIVDAALLVRRGAAQDAELPRLARRQGMATALWLLLETQERLLGVDGGGACARNSMPGALARACLHSLQVPRRALTREAQQWIGFKRWLLWVSAPSAGIGLRHVARFLRPGEAELLDAGLTDGRRGAPVTARFSPAHALSLCKLAAYQLWCLLRHAARRS